jgi:hypothetical protein
MTKKDSIKLFEEKKVRTVWEVEMKVLQFVVP